MFRAVAALLRARRTVRVPAWIITAILLNAATASATGINLAWDDCGDAGQAIKEFACDTNTGAPFDLVASFVPPDGIDRFIGVSARIRFAAPDYPDWWKIGTCRPSSALGISFDASESCVSPWGGQSGGGFLFTIGGLGANTGRLLVQIANADPMSLGSTTEYTAFRVHISRSRTAGSESCSGCALPVVLNLEQIQVFETQGSGADPVLTNPITGATAYWQGHVGVSPTITSFSPSGGGSGTLVTVTGTGLSNTSIVRFGGGAAIASPISDSQVRTFVPVSVLPGPIEVQTPFGSATSGQDFSPAPAIVYTIPPSAPVGTSVSLHGRGFTGAIEVRFGGVPASFELMSDSRITAVVPAGAATGAIEVSNAGGTGRHGPFLVGPMRGGINLSWDECADQGEDFATFTCGQGAGTFRLIGSFVPPADIMQAKWVGCDIAISTSALPDWWRLGSGACLGTTVSADFVHESVCESPRFWVGGGSFTYGLDYRSNIARLGVRNNFAGDGVRLFPDREYYAFKLIFVRQRYSHGCSDCDAPAKFELLALGIHQAFELGYDPVIKDPILRTVAYWQSAPGDDAGFSGFTPPGGPSGTLVTLSGSGFTGTRSVRFGETEAPFNVVSDATIETMVPLHVSTGPIRLAGSRGPHSSEDLFYSPPEVLTVIPPEGFEGDEVEIQGDNLAGTRTVTFNGVPASFTVKSMNLLKAIVPEGATTGPVAVTNPGGTEIGNDFVVLDDTTPVLAALTRGEALPDRIRLGWELPRGGEVVLYRREALGPWRQRARLMADATRRIEYEDRDVVAGRTYGYRLGLRIGSQEIFAGDVTLTTPLAASGVLELYSVSWERGRLRASLMLPAAGAATIEIFDLGGRRQAERRIESPASGAQTVEWDAPGLASGVYFARLTQQARTVKGRFVVAQ